ncbi:hypothetical protein [Teredinibacter haidensis]|uniref:hypothetical protein n=1 Tax=Teredinibacter haidensis TaxID=2731755 RepID=UPI000948C9DE|nr:hypothetical protein [Teredinibacter haidensis]
MKALNIIIICLSLSLVHSAIAASVNVKKLVAQEWIVIENDRFSIISNATEKQASAMLQELENFHYLVSNVFGFGEIELAEKIPIVLVNNESVFRALGMPRDYVGIFLSSKRGGAIFARADKFRSADKGQNWGRLVVLHELAHLLMSHSHRKLISSPWFNEGIAEYLGSYTLNNNQIILGNLSTLRSGFFSPAARSGRRYDSVDTESLFKVTQEDLKVGLRSSREHNMFVDKFYARSAAVVHYFDANEQRRNLMYQYLALIQKGAEVDNAFEQVFDMDFDDLDRKVNAYVRGRAMTPRVFSLDRSDLEFAPADNTLVDITPLQIMQKLYGKISLFSDEFLGKGTRAKMNEEFETVFPEFFQ